MIRFLRPLPVVCTSVFFLGLALSSFGDDPPALNPFGNKPRTREDAIPGYLEMSDGRVHLGQVYITREHRLKIFDEAQNRFREVPLPAIAKIECQVLKEWQEKEWRFKENANDEKVYTGRSYPAREYTCIITLRRGGTIKGPMSAIFFVQGEGSEGAQRFLVHKRDKGEYGEELKELLYVRCIGLGEKAVAEGKKKIEDNDRKKEKPVKRGSGRR